jgi:uncharacterized protein (TIGR03437 family)
MLPARAALLLCFLVAVPLPCRGQIRVLNVASSANFVPGRLNPGGLASVFCTGIQDIPGLVTAPGYPLPGTLAGVKVTVNGTVAPILAIANLAGGTYQQINIQIPWEVTTKSGLAFDVSQQGTSSIFATYADSPWPVFFVDSSGYAIAQHANDFRPVTPGDAARPGEWIIVYATNLGPVHNQPPDGYPADARDLAPIAPDSSPYLLYYGLAVGPSANYMSTRIQSNYIGLLPGSIVYQVNLLVPGSWPTGELVFQLVDIYDCGFFFVHGCGRSFTTHAESMPAKVPVAN